MSRWRVHWARLGITRWLVPEVPSRLSPHLGDGIRPRTGCNGGIGTGRALAAGANEDEVADVLLAIAPVTGLGRVVSAPHGVATALEYDTAAALEEPD